eukprot:jgi/Tetstr1/420800/TSEL_011876.t1
MQLTARHHSLIGGTRTTDRTEYRCKTVSTGSQKIKAAPAPAPAEPPADAAPSGPMTDMHADGEDKLELNYEKSDITMDVDDNAHRGAAEVPCMADVSLDSPGALYPSAHSAKAHLAAPQNEWSTSKNSLPRPPRC